MDHKTYLTNKHFCPIPWTGFMYNFDGKVKHCIRSPTVLGDINHDSISDILTNDTSHRHKTNMLQNIPSESCSVCYNLESDKRGFDIISDRVFYLKELKTVDKSLYDNTSGVKLYKTDIRWSNVCNFACVYCGSEFSSKWAAELGVVQPLPPDHRIQELKELVLENVTDLKHVYLAGGEPLLMKENYELLTVLKEKNPAVHLRVNTNLSKVDTKVFDLLCGFKNVHWTVSVESIGEEYDYIRFGGSWSDFQDNLNVIRKLDHKISFNMLHFLLNYLSIFDCIEYLQHQGFHNNSFIIGPVANPTYLNIRHLPAHMLNSIKLKLDDVLSTSPGFLLEDGLRNIQAHINTPYEKNIEYSLQKIQELDRRRGIDSRQVFRSFYNSLGEYHG